MIERVDLHNFVEHETVDDENFWSDCFQRKWTNYSWNMKRSESCLHFPWDGKSESCWAFQVFFKGIDLKGFLTVHYYFKRLSSEKMNYSALQKLHIIYRETKAWWVPWKVEWISRCSVNNRTMESFKLFHVRTTVDERNNKRYLMKNLTFRCFQTSLKPSVWKLCSRFPEVSREVWTCLKEIHNSATFSRKYSSRFPEH